MKAAEGSGGKAIAYTRINLLVMFSLSLAGAGLNAVFARLFQFGFGLPLFMDTLFTVAVTLSCGLLGGLLTGVVSTLIYVLVYYITWLECLYALCNIAVALITALFIRLFPRELSFPINRSARRGTLDRVIVLIILSFVMCMAMSLMGGLIAVIVSGGNGPEIPFKMELYRRNFPFVLVEVLSRIPLNVVDRLIAVFGGYGVAALLSLIGAAPLRHPVPPKKNSLSNMNGNFAP
jgi:hypothetical protein